MYFFAWLFGGFIGGLVIFLTILFTRYGVIFAVIITALFLPFHISDLKAFFREKNYLVFLGRLFCLYLIASYIGGFVAMAGGLMKIGQNQFNLIALVISYLFSYAAITFFGSLTLFFPESHLMKSWQRLYRGLFKIGVFWDH